MGGRQGNFKYIFFHFKVVSEIITLHLKAKNFDDFPLCIMEQSNEVPFQLWVQLFLTENKKGESQ